MIARNAKNRREVMLVGLIELPEILGCLTVEVNTVAEEVEEGRICLRMGRVTPEITLHPVCNELLWNGVFDAADVAIDVKDERLRLLDCRDLLRRQDVGKIKS